jgi:cell division protein FtsI (penicillin-binding protein 3)
LLLGGILVFWMLMLTARLYDLEVIQYVDLLARAQRQQEHTIEIAPQRGTIYDRQMNPLAMSLVVESVYAVPSQIPDRGMVAKLLAPVLGLEADDLAGRFQAFRSFCWVKRKVTTSEATRVRELNLKGIYFQEETKRFYPKGDLAAQVLGYVGLDDRGLGGLEYSLDSAIKGGTGRVLVTADARHRSFHSTGWSGEPGKNVVLTLDEKVQYIAEKALAEAVRQFHAAGGTAIVQNPNTGEILALANEPTFNPNEYGKSPANALRDRGVSWVFEPGSTFKVVTVSAALEEKLANPREVVNCQEGSIVLAGHTIHDHKPFGDLTVTDVLVNSSDVGAIKLGLRLGEERLYKYVRDFGFGAKTDVELPGEERGLLKPPRRWSGISIGEISMGQEISVTGLQLVTAYSAIANGGILFEPRIVHDIYRGSEHEALPPVSGRRVVSERTAELMKQMLAAVVERGTGKPAAPAGYSAAGKTGTAQKVDPSGTYSHTHYVASFVGFAPVARPVVTILVAIDSPVGAIYGTEVAAPVFRSIAEQTLTYLNTPQDNPSRWPQIVSSAPARPAVQKRAGREGHLPKDLEFAGAATSPVRPASYSTSLAGAGAAPQQAGDPAASRTMVLDEGPLVNVPDFSGLAARLVAEECQKLGLELNISGSGLVVEQKPAPRTRVPEKTPIWVRLAR